MPILRPLALFFAPVLLVLGAGLGRDAPRDSSRSHSERSSPALDLSTAERLEDGQGVEALENQMTDWALEMGREDAAAGQDALVVMLTRARTETIRRRAIEGVVTLGSIDWPEDYRGAFLRSVAPGALEAALHHGVPASVTLAQAIQESGWGRSGLAREHHNLFGIKAGASSQAVVMPTVEVSGGRERHVRARFRTFDSPADSVAHHGALLSQDHRYGAAQDHRDSWRDFLDALAPVYASDPRYAQRVGWLIERYELDRWDRWVSELAPHDA